MTRRLVNWLPLGMTYAFLCMGRFNLIVAQDAMGPLISKQDFGIIFGIGNLVYALSFLVNGPLIDKKLGGKNGMLIAALGSALANIALGLLTYFILVKHIKVNLVLAFSVIYSINMYFQSYGAVSIIKVKAYWFHVRERGVFGAIFGTLISFGVYFAFDWGGSIITLTKALAPNNLLKTLFTPLSGIADATWAVFYIPAAALIFWLLMDIWLIKDTPEEAGFPHLDTCDASSGQMHIEFSVMELLKKIFSSPLMLMIAFVELTSGVFRYGMSQWYRVFTHEMPQHSVQFFSLHWGWLTCIFGIIGGFAGGLISDRWFNSRRGPPAALMCGFVAVVAGLMGIFLFSQPYIVGWAAVAISMASIGITSLMSGTAATDFGGRKATATCAGIVDGFAYLGSALQSVCLGFIVTRGGWQWWPIFLIPFAIAGLWVAIKLWYALPVATQKYIDEVEQKAVIDKAAAELAA
ncbi:MAG TPA: MFS transporter [Verrucomicrobiae bacterium]|nr:MFS transporter [Verrucomicrobiae bacterium]